VRKTLLAAALLLAASPALAAPRPPSRASSSAPGSGGNSLSGWLVLDPGPFDGVGVGGRVGIPLAPQGVLHNPRVRDDITLEVGADFVHYSLDFRYYDPYYGYYGDWRDANYSWNGILAVGGVAWNFWFTPQFALYPKVDLGYFFGWYSGWDDAAWGSYGRASYGGLFLQGAAGLIYRFQTMSLRVELGSGLLRAGVGMSF
jgi:hypothetical protein